MNPLMEAFQLLLLMSNALNGVAVGLSPTCSLTLGTVSRFEEVGLLDDKDKPTGENAPAIFFTSGEQVVLTPEQSANFVQMWNLKSRIDADLIAHVANIHAQHFQQPAAAPQTEAAEAQS